MSVPDQPTIFVYTGNGVSTTFAYGFYLLTTDDIVVALNDVVQTSGFTVNGVGSQTGGSVIFNTAPADGVTVQIMRQVAVERETDYQQNGDLRAATLNLDFDRLWMALQDTIRDKNSALRYPAFENLNGLLPAKGTRMNGILGFDPNGVHTIYPLPASVGAGDMVVDTFATGVGFTPDVTTQLILSRAPGTPANAEVFFDSMYQGPDQWSVSGTLLTFTSPIPSGVQKVFVRLGTTLSSLIPAAGSAGDAQIAWAGILSRVVTSISDLRKLSKVRYDHAFAAGYYASGDGGGGQYWMDASDTTSVDDGGSVIVADDGARWKLISTSVVSVRQFGAKGDNATDDSAAFQKWLDYLTGKTQPSTRTGVKGRIPGGRYILSNPLQAMFRNDNAIIDDGDFRRLSIEGDGQANTYLIYNGPSGAFALQVAGYVQGPNSGGSHLYLQLKGFRLWRDLASPKLGGGLSTDDVAYISFDDVSIGYFNVNAQLTDTLLITGYDTIFTGGNGGVTAAKSNFSNPNVAKWTRCGFTGNLSYGVQATAPANWSFDTCSFEGNGNSQVNSNTILIQGGPAEGGCSLSVRNCYFEGNEVLCDINVGFNTTVSGTVIIEDNSFNRSDVSKYAKSHISLACTSTGTMTASIGGNAYKSFNTYVPNAANPVALIQTAGITASESKPNYYQNAIERPNYQGYPVNGDAYGKLWATARVTSGGALTVGWNVASITKTGTGVYRLNYKNPLVVSATVIAAVTIVGNDGWGYVSGENANYLEITTKNAAGAATDQNFNVIANAQG